HVQSLRANAREGCGAFVVLSTLMHQLKQVFVLVAGMMGGNPANQPRDIAGNLAFTILPSAIAIQPEVEYWRSLGMDYAGCRFPRASRSLFPARRPTRSRWTRSRAARAPTVKETRPDGKFWRKSSGRADRRNRLCVCQQQ